jgi:two-component system nitrogen regulation response regulator NtrX
MDGLDLLGRLRREAPDLPVVMISAHGDLETAVRAVREGAYDYLVKPIDDKRLYHTIAKALEFHQLRRDYVAVQHEARAEDDLLGQSPSMTRLREEIQRAAPSDARILILGENGTGKELVAKRLHELSNRRERPFIKLNSAAIPRELIESELFGHEAGAFTGAQRMKKGKLELASGGSLFLDEIGDMSDETQSKLLRVLASEEYERVGGSRTLRFDARLITATNRELLIAIAEGSFREDLYHRIAVIPLRVPPLRERGSDIDALADHFLRRFSANQGRQPPAFTGPAHDLLRTHGWPGNVRELRNLMERIAIMHPTATVERSDLEPWLSSGERRAEGSAGLVHQWKDEQRQTDRERILRTLEEAGWNVSRAAERLGIDRASLHRKMKRLRVERPGRPEP